MKILRIISIALISVSACFAQTDSLNVEANTWEKANSAYAQGQFQVAEVLYSQMVEEGYRDAAVFYNLGNACFQQNQIGKAILNYKRAALADPSDKDIAYNLEIAESRTKDKIDKVPSFFLSEWVTSIREIMSPDGWAKLSIICLVIGLASALLWLIASNMSLRKLGFYSTVIMAVLVIISIANGLSSASEIYNSDEAIIVASAAVVKSSPSDGGKDLCVIHEGTCVTLIQTLDNWYEAELEDGTKGWIVNSCVEKINLN